MRDSSSVRLRHLVAVLVLSVTLAACGSPAGTASPAASESSHSTASAGSSPNSSLAKPSASTASASASAAVQPQWSAGDPSGDAVRISYASPALSGLPLYAALSGGFFKRQHLMVRMLKLPSTAAITALSKGEIDMVNQPSLAIQGASRGLPFRVVLSLWKQAPWTLVGKTDLKSIADLKNRVVATTAVGSSPYLYLQAALKKVNMDITHDVKVISSRGTEDSFAFLLAGKVDAIVVSPPFDAEAEARGFHEIAALGDALDLPYVGLGTSTDYIAQHRPVVVRSIRALLDASDWLKAHPSEAVSLAETYVGTDAPLAQKSVGKMLPLLSTNGETTLQGIQQAIDAQARVTHTAIDMKPEQFVDYGPLHDARSHPTQGQ